MRGPQQELDIIIGTFFLAIPRCRRRLKQNLTKSSMEDFPNIAIHLQGSLSYLSALVREVYRYAAVCFEYSLHPVKCVSRWKPIFPLGRSLFLSNMMVTCWHPCLFKASRISWTFMISTTTIISLPTLLWSPTNGIPHSKYWTKYWNLPHFSYSSIGRCWMTNGSIQNRTNSGLSIFWSKDNLTIRLETRRILRLGSVGGEHCLFFPSVCVSLSIIIAVLVEFAPENISLTVTLAVASVLSTFDLVRKVDEREYTESGIR